MSVPRNSVSKPVLSALIKHPYTEIPVADLAKETGFTLTQVSNAVIHLRDKGIRIEIPMRGVYRYVPGAAPTGKPVAEPPKPSKLLFEEIGRTKSGEIVVEGEDGALYKLCEL